MPAVTAITVTTCSRRTFAVGWCFQLGVGDLGVGERGGLVDGGGGGRVRDVVDAVATVPAEHAAGAGRLDGRQRLARVRRPHVRLLAGALVVRLVVHVGGLGGHRHRARRLARPTRHHRLHTQHTPHYCLTSCSARNNFNLCGVVVSGVRRMNEVNARRARLVLGWVTVFGRVYHLGM